MAMSGVLRLWNEWEIQILVVVSFALQVLLLSFAWMRRRSISGVLRILLWLMYLLAEYTATYTLGHMSIIGGKPGEHRQLMAFWAPFLLLHLGGQDTITAYAMEDSQLWLRHLLTFAVQALGAGYVLYRYIGSRGGPLVAPAVLMFAVGVLKNAERVWALSFSRLEMIRRYLDGVSINQDYCHLNPKRYYPGLDCLLPREVHLHVHNRLLPPQATATPAGDGGGDRSRSRQPKPGACWDFCLAGLALAGGGLLQTWWKPRKKKRAAADNDDDDDTASIDLAVAAKRNKKPLLELDDESVLQGAHDLLYICMGQFVDDKIWPSQFQKKAMDYFHEHGKTFQLVEMQLSLMYDIFYTKAAVIHTWYGRCFRAISLLGTATAFFLFLFQFQFSISSSSSTTTTSSSKDGYNRVDATVTHVLVAGALILEAASVLRAMGSTWTCAMLRERECGWLHGLHVSLRRRVWIARARRWSDSIGQLNLLDSYSYTGDDDDDRKTIARSAASDKQKAIMMDDDETSRRRQEEAIIIAKYKQGRRRRRRLHGGGGLGSKIFSLLRDGGRSMIPAGAKELVLEEIQSMVEACEGEEAVMRSYRGQCTLKRLGRAGLFSLLLQDAVTGTDFDQSILDWHLATDKFLMHSKTTYEYDGEAGEGDNQAAAGPGSGPGPGPLLALVEATKAVSNYMMFLLVECPYMLPSPVRPTLHLQAKKVLRERHYWRRFIGVARDSRRRRRSATSNVVHRVTDPGAKLADELLRMEEESSSVEMPAAEPNKQQQELLLLQVVFRVWVEMLCYAAHHCSRESHARQLNNGGEFLTAVWLVTTAEFNRVYYSPRNFRARKPGSVWNMVNFVDFADFMEPVLESRWYPFIMSWLSSVLSSAFMRFIRISFSVVFSLAFLPIRGVIFLLMKTPWSMPPDDY